MQMYDEQFKEVVCHEAMKMKKTFDISTDHTDSA